MDVALLTFRQLLALVAAQDKDRAAAEAALAVLRKKASPRLGFYMRQVGVGAQIWIDDLQQELWFAVWRLAYQYDTEKGRPINWLFRVAKSVATHHRRAEERQKRSNGETTVYLDCGDVFANDIVDHRTDEPSEQAESGQMTEMLNECLDRLSPKHQAVLRAVFYERLDYREAADKLGIRSKSTVERRVKAAIKRLREMFDTPDNDVPTVRNIFV